MTEDERRKAKGEGARFYSSFVLRPSSIAGLLGMLIVAGLYVAHALLLRTRGTGLETSWLLLLLLPGLVAGYLAGEHNSLREGTLAGLLVAGFAVPLQVVVLLISVVTTDWAHYAALVGADIATGVQEAAVPATIIASLATIVVTLIGCILAGWLGAVIYVAIRATLDRIRGF